MGGTSIRVTSCHPAHRTSAPRQGPASSAQEAGAVYLMEPPQRLNAQTSTFSLTTCLSAEPQFKVALETKRVIFLVKMKAVHFKPNA